MIKVRQARYSDVNSIIQLLEELGRQKARNKSDRTKFARLVRNHITKKDKMILVAEDYSTIAGMASLVFIPRLNQPRQELWIPDMIVSGNYQNKGVGKALARKFTKIAKEKDCFRIRLESGNTRRQAHAFYKKMGFEQFAISFRKQL